MAEAIVGPLAELPPGARRIVRLGAMEVGVFNVDGELHALPNVCPHQFGPLCRGAISGTVVARVETDFRPAWVYEGRVLTCPWHGLEFDISSGRCMAYARVKLRQYRVEADAEGTVRVFS